MEYNVITSIDETENFIQQCIQVFQDEKLDTKPGMANIFTLLLSDIAANNREGFAKIMESCNSYAKIASYVKDVYSAFKNNEEIMGIRYKILTEKDYGYRIAYNSIHPVNRNFEPRLKGRINEELASFSRPVGDMSGMVLVALN